MKNGLANSSLDFGLGPHLQVLKGYFLLDHAWGSLLMVLRPPCGVRDCSQPFGKACAQPTGLSDPWQASLRDTMLAGSVHGLLLQLQRKMPFSLPDNRKIRVNGTKEPIEFKSNQWFGATVKAHRGKVVVSILSCLGGTALECGCTVRGESAE